MLEGGLVLIWELDVNLELTLMYMCSGVTLSSDASTRVLYKQDKQSWTCAYQAGGEDCNFGATEKRLSDS